MDLAEWLLEQIAKDERIARSAIADDDGETEGLAGQRDWLTGRSTRVNSPRFGDALADLTVSFAVPSRVLAECEVKRRIVRQADEPNSAQGWDDYASAEHELTLRLLALAYADRPGYLDEWRP